MTDFSYRGYRGSITVRRFDDGWSVRTDIFTPRDLVHEIGDRIHVNDALLPFAPIERVKLDAVEQAKRVIDNVVKSRDKTS
jgi:hypothetical protein